MLRNRGHPAENEPLASVVVDGILGPQHVHVLGTCFSADSRHVCYVADESRSGLKTPRIYVDGWAGPEFEEIHWPRRYSTRWSNEDDFGGVESAQQKPSGLRFLDDGTMEFLAIRKETLYRAHVDLNHVIP